MLQRFGNILARSQTRWTRLCGRIRANLLYFALRRFANYFAECLDILAQSAVSPAIIILSRKFPTRGSTRTLGERVRVSLFEESRSAMRLARALTSRSSGNSADGLLKVVGTLLWSDLGAAVKVCALSSAASVPFDALSKEKGKNVKKLSRLYAKRMRLCEERGRV